MFAGPELSARSLLALQISPCVQQRLCRACNRALTGASGWLEYYCVRMCHTMPHTVHCHTSAVEDVDSQTGRGLCSARHSGSGRAWQHIHCEQCLFPSA